MVVHVLKSGKTVNDVSGHLVKERDAPLVYLLIERINSEVRSRTCAERK